MPLPTDLDLALLELDTYAAIPTGVVFDVGCDRAVMSYLAGHTVLSIRGTDDAAGWVSDFKMAGVRSKGHPELGTCESGFLDGALALWPLIEPMLGVSPVVIQGHSRGAGMIPILAGLMLLAGVKPDYVCCWEAPWAVGPQCRDMLMEAGIPGVQFWHGDDPVCCIPAVPWLCSHVWPIRHFGSWALDPFDCHFMEGIVATLAACPP